jgi:non-heme chloroperoxidase
VTPRVEFTHHVVAGLGAIRARLADQESVGRLLFVHGLFGGAWVWDQFAPYFALRGWDCWSLTRRGLHRGSGSEVGRLRLTDDVADVTAIAAELGAPALIGHSLGGLLVLKTAEQTAAPAVVALTPAPPRGVFALRHLALLGVALRHAPAMVLGRPMLPGRRLMDRVALHRLDPVERERVWRRLVPESARQVFGITVPGLAVSPGKVRCPCLVVAAGADRLTPPGMVRRIARRYGATCYEYARLGHMVPLERGWSRVAAGVCAWLERIPRARLHPLLEPEGLAQQQAVPHAALTHRQRPEAGDGHQLLQHHGAGHDDVGARGLQAMQPPSPS